ncbi:MAG: radical SAM protein [Nitrososphaeraceae archaeon]
MPDSEDEIKGKIEVNEMYEIGKVDGEKIGEEENRQQPIGEYDDSEDKNILIDNFGRIAKKLRVSVTDRCNMRCMYCMPRGNVRWFNEQDVLDYREISRLVSILANLGIERIRLTGGEPLLRPKLENLIVSLAKLEGINSISMTTNGLLFGEKAKKLKDAGLESVNISLDTFRPARFKAITGLDSINKVIEAINAAENVGLNVKINTVVIRGWNDDEIVDFARFARDTGHIVRFIEFMPLDGSGIWQSNLVYTKREMIDQITKNLVGVMPLNNTSNRDLEDTNGINYKNISKKYYNQNYESDPARLYSFCDGRGTIGFIPSMTEPFCASCDRMRLTSDGRLLACLFENPGYDLRNMLRSSKSNYYIKKKIAENVMKKPEGIIKIIKTAALKPSLNLMHTIGG